MGGMIPGGGATIPGHGIGGDDLARMFMANQAVAAPQVAPIQQPVKAPVMGSMAPIPAPQAPVPAQGAADPFELPSFRESASVPAWVPNPTPEMESAYRAGLPEDGIFSDPKAYAGFAGRPFGGRDMSDAAAMEMADHNAAQRGANEVMRRMAAAKRPEAPPAPSEAQTMAQQLNSPESWQRFGTAMQQMGKDNPSRPAPVAQPPVNTGVGGQQLADLMRRMGYLR